LFLFGPTDIRSVVAKRALKPSVDGILDAAEAVLAEQPYADISLRTLMSAAQVSTTAFYARFDSKEAVVAALTARLFAELHQGAPGVLDGARDLETGIERGVDLLCERFGERKPLVRLILSETGGSPAAVEARQIEYHLLAGFLAMRLAGFKRVRLADPQALAWALIGALEIQIVRWAVWNEIDLPTMRAHLIAAARAILPRKETP
jgi:AcrR family transcriptional regulator